MLVPRRWGARFLHDPGSLLGLIIVVIALLSALLAPVLPLDDPTQLNLQHRLLSPSVQYPLGTDHLGRDELSRILYGARTTLGLSGIALVLIMGIALVVGSLSGYYGGWLDTFLMALVDLLLAFPALILGIAVAGILGPSLINVLIAVSVVWWAGHARVIRGMVLSARQREYVEAARAIGASDVRIVVYHIARNILGPFVVLATLDMGWIILGIAGLNFLGLGAQPPTPEWGAMLNDSRSYLQTAPRLLLIPGTAIFLLVLGFNLLGDGLRDILDPTTYRP
ncbi:MAG: ABC transporter permease subunit [Chloroflexi bacterium]|nr:ABC transporter permease subunit [Chloroflexota bacterium]MDA1219876.1 ABC transporter permease subunit [Chloroflexota bacterium]